LIPTDVFIAATGLYVVIKYISITIHLSYMSTSGAGGVPCRNSPDSSVGSFSEDWGIEESKKEFWRFLSCLVGVALKESRNSVSMK